MKAELLKLTKNTLLKYVSQEQIFEKYFGFIPEEHVLYKNPKRTDNTPGCSFHYRDNGKLIFNDFSRGVQWDCFDLAQVHYSCTFAQCLDRIAVDFGIKGNFTTPLLSLKRADEVVVPKEKIYNHIEITRERKFKQEDLDYWSIGGLIITQEMLEANKIFAIRHLWEHIPGKVRYFSPDKLNVTFAYHWEGYNYQIYFPLKKKENGERRFINPPLIKFGDIEFLDHTANHIVITKSKKDAFYLRLFGINAFFIINESILLDENVMKIVNKFPNKFSLFDNDRTGRRAAWKYRKTYNVTPLFYDKTDGKDTFDVLKVLQKDGFSDLIEYAKNYYGI